MAIGEPDQPTAISLVEGARLSDLVDWDDGADTVLDHAMRRAVELAAMGPTESIALFESGF